MARTTRTARPKLSPVQFLKASIIRMGLARKVKVRSAKPRTNRDGRPTNVRFQFIWHRIALLFVALMALGWISLATGAYFFVKHAREFPDVRFVDLVFPHRWDYYRTARGDYYIAQAQKKLEAGETAGVIHLVRVGVQQSPDNTEGRLLLAQIHNALGRPDLGIAVLKERVNEHSDNIDYLNTLISLLFNNHDDQEVEALAMSLLGESSEPTERNLILAVAAGTANFNRGNYDRAEEIIERFDLLKSRTGTLLQARIDWDLGEAEQAIKRLEQIMTNPGPQEAQTVDYLIEYLWSSGHERRAEQVAFSRFIADPLDHAPRLRLLYIYEKRGDSTRELAETEAFIRLFADDPDAMVGLATFAARTGNPDLARQVYENAQAKAQPLAWPAILLMEASLEAGAHRQALEFYEQIEASVADWTPLQQTRLKPILAVAHLGAGNTERGEGALTGVFADRNLNPGDLITLSDRLTAIDHFSHAREVLLYLHRAQPLNQEALTRLIRLDIERGNNREIVSNLRRLLEMRKPSPEILEKARRHISSDRFIFQAERTEMLRSLETALVNRPSQAS